MNATLEVQELNIYISYYTLENVSKQSKKNIIVRGQISLLVVSKRSHYYTRSYTFTETKTI
jgi:exonuclease VII large subunit